MSDFINNSSNYKLMENLKVVLQMDSFNISIEGGIVYVISPNKTESVRRRFGGIIPEGVESITIKDITMMRIYRNAKGCDYVDGNYELQCTINSIINGKVVGTTESASDGPAGKSQYGMTAVLSAIVEILFRSTEAKLNYDTSKGLSVSLRNFTGETLGTGYRIEDYIAVVMEASDEIYWYYGGHTS